MNEYDIAKLYQEMELHLISSLKRNLKGHIKTESGEEIDYPQWQALKLKQLEKVQKENLRIINKYSENIPRDVRRIIKREYKQGRTSEQKLYNKTKLGNGHKMNESFFNINNDKVNALINEINGTVRDSNHAIFRMMNDKYRSTIFKSEFFLQNGVVSLDEAINMSLKDFIKSGINCIQYADGRRVNIADYTRMAVRTASQRATLIAEGDFRKKIGRSLILVSKHNTSCNLCKHWENQVLVDDIYSGGEEDGKHKTLSEAMSKGLYHPNCRHSAPTYYPELDEVYNDIAKGRTLQEEEESLRDAISQYKQRERRKEVWESKNTFDSKGRITVKDNSLLKNDIINYFDKYNKNPKYLDKVFTKENYYIGDLPDIDIFKDNEVREVVINKRGIITILKKHKEMKKEEILEIFSILNNNKIEIYKEGEEIYFLMKGHKKKYLDLGMRVKEDENYVFHYSGINPKYYKRKKERLIKIK